MPEFSVPIPQFKAWLDPRFWTTTPEAPYERCVAHRLISVPGQAIRFTVLTERGALFHGVPIHMLVLEPHVAMELDVLELWNCFSYYAVAYADPLRTGMEVDVRLADNSITVGQCMFSIDWYEPHATRALSHGWCEMPDEHKEAHVIALPCGCIAAQPGNRIIWHEPSLVTSPWDLGKDKPPYRTNTEVFSVEGRDARTDSGGGMFYDVGECQPQKSRTPTKKLGKKRR